MLDVKPLEMVSSIQHQYPEIEYVRCSFFFSIRSLKRFIFFFNFYIKHFSDIDQKLCTVAMSNISSHDKAILNRIFNPNLPYGDVVEEDKPQEDEGTGLHILVWQLFEKKCQICVDLIIDNEIQCRIDYIYL